jgi:hypothetical protein
MSQLREQQRCRSILCPYNDFHHEGEMHVAIMLRVADQRRGAELDEQDRQLLSMAIRAFRAATQCHSAGRNEGPGGVHDDYQTAEDHEDAVETLCTRWIRRGTLKAGDARALREHLVYLLRLHRRHITRDERQFQRSPRATLKVLS